MAQQEPINRARYCLCFLMVIILSIAISRNSPIQLFKGTKITIPQSSSLFDSYLKLEWNRTISDPNFGGYFWGDDEYLYTSTTETYFPGYISYLRLIKWHSKGILIWTREWFIDGHEKATGMWGDNSFLYTCGVSISDANLTHNSTYESLIVKWDKNGNPIWNKTWNSGFEDVLHDIWGDDQFLYIIGTTTNSTIDQSWDVFEIPSKLGQQTNVSLIKMDFDGIIEWKKTWRGSRYFSLAPQEGELFDSQLSRVSFDLWGDTNYVYYLENDELKLMKWEKSGNLIWNMSSGLQKTFPDCYYYALCGDSTSLYSCGASENGSLITKINKEGYVIWNRTVDTLNWLVDIYNLEDYLYCTGSYYFDNELWQRDDISIVKLDKEGYIVSNSSWCPFPESSYYETEGTCVWANGNDVYILAAEAFPHSGIYSGYLLKWKIAPPYFLYFGVPPVGIVAIGTILWLWIKPLHRFKRKQLTEKLMDTRKVLQNTDYRNGIKKLDELLPSVEELKDSELLKEWELLHKKCNIDMHFIEQFNTQKRIIEQGDLKIAITNLVAILKDANSDAYVGFVDKRIVSDIADLLKSATSQQEVE